jgi:hypothetical protein
MQERQDTMREGRGNNREEEKRSDLGRGREAAEPHPHGHM